MNIFWKDAEKKFKLTEITDQHVTSLSTKFDLKKLSRTKIREFLVKDH